MPVEVASDEVPLVRDPAVLPLLDALRAVVNLDNDDLDHVDYLDPARAEALLLGPLGGLDAGDVRRLARQLRAREKEQSKAEDRAPRTSRELVRARGRRARLPRRARGPGGGPRPGARPAAASTPASELAGGASAEELLWTLWSRTGWPARLRRSVDLGGGAARRAHRDLDSVCALFEVAARAEEQRDHVGVRAFLATLVQQQIPADTLADRGARGAAVRLLTAHRSKGLEWRLVVVAHVQQEGWPDLRRRSTLLQADRIGEDGLVPPVSARELLMEERRLFYVACTRARQRLVVTAVASAEDDGEQPSRFLDELGVTRRARSSAARSRPLSMTGLVSELRRTLADPATSRAAPRGRRPPAGPAGRGVGRPARPGAERRPVDLVGHPRRQPLGAAGARPRPAGAGLGERARVADGLPDPVVPRARGRRRRPRPPVRQPRRAAARARPAGRDRRASSPRVDVLMEHVDAVWDRLDFRTPWSKAREHERVRAALGRFLQWHVANPRRLLETEARVLDRGRARRRRAGRS